LYGRVRRMALLAHLFRHFCFTMYHKHKNTANLKLHMSKNSRCSYTIRCTQYDRLSQLQLTFFLHLIKMETQDLQSFIQAPLGELSQTSEIFPKNPPRYPEQGLCSWTPLGAQPQTPSISPKCLLSPQT